MAHVISICNYSFIATNGKKITETYKRNRASLIGDTVEVIKADATGRNYSQIKKDFLRENKTRKNLGEFKFRLRDVEICTHDLKGNLLRKSYTSWD